ncbi:MAG: glycosyltransferase family 4 protein [Paraglaciecola sp.]|uniref:glycosyltransferase family 4 protein n=1 Tax=Paraglaciecola sp. TaxID=1920173 RepID=UPI0032990D91
MEGQKYIVGVTEMHGAYEEVRLKPPKNFDYIEMPRLGPQFRFLRSPIKGYFHRFDDSNVNIVESVISPVVTNKPWFFSLAVYQEALAFNFLGLPTPKFLRSAIVNYLLKKDNCIGLLFWSQAGLETAKSYGGITNKAIINKMHVVYPAVRKISVQRTCDDDKVVRLLFSGDFFRKGGMNVVDTFLTLCDTYTQLELIVCSSETIDFNGCNSLIRKRYLNILKDHHQIQFLGRIPREQLLDEIMPKIDIYLLPTYNEAFGFAVLEAMAFGIPVVATNIMALPELIVDDQTGYLIDVSEFDIDTLFKGYVVDNLPTEFIESVTSQLLQKLEDAINNPGKRRDMGKAAQQRACEMFSIEARNSTMKRLYDACL